ncbi:MAG: hypothetical protein LBT35_04060, partial [Tannerella sp.]|nr:hypothetical protein [Tannerella sp.]
MKIYMIAFVALLLIACKSQNKQANEKLMNTANHEQTLNKIKAGTIATLIDDLNSASDKPDKPGEKSTLKALIDELNRIGLKEENAGGANNIFTTLRHKADSLTQPAKSVVYSMLAQMYEDYYNQNAQTINRRTTTNIEKEDIHTWDARSLAEEAVKYYNLSLRDATVLQAEPVDNYKDILTAGYEGAYQPTLYDVLANRALKYYASNFNVHSLPGQMFVINNPDYLADAVKFAEMTVETPDSLSPRYLALTTYQSLLRFHIEKSGFAKGRANDDVSALIEADLRRLNYITNNNAYNEADRLYREALERSSETYKPYSRNARVLLQLGECYLQQGQRWVSDKSDVNKSGYTRALELCERIRREYPGELTSKIDAMQETIENKSLNVTFEETQQPDKPFLAHLGYRNIQTLHITAYPLTEQEAINYKLNFRRYNNQGKVILKDFVNNLSGAPLQQRIDIPENSDYQHYKTVIMMNAMPSGMYLVLFSDRENFFENGDEISFFESFLQISPLVAQTQLKNNELSIMAIDRDTGAPLAAADIKVVSEHDTIKHLTGNRDGIALLAMSDYNKENVKYYVVTHKGEKLYCFEHHGWWGYQRKTQQAIAFLTDRAIYRPGQTVYFKAILYDRPLTGENKLRTGEKVDINFRDVNNQVISSIQLTTNDFGSVDGAFTIPQGLLNGRMMIECPNYGSTSIKVEEYKRPTFDVEFEPVREAVKLGDKVSVKATVKALAGYAIDNAKVQYRVQRTMRLRYPRFYMFSANMNERQVASGVTATDAKGQVEIDFTAIAGDAANDKIIYTYTVTADVTDVNGETHSATLGVNAGNKPLIVNTDLPDNILSSKSDTYSVSTTNLDGVKTSALVKVEIIALAPPRGILRGPTTYMDMDIDYHLIKEDVFRRYFPFDAYGDELNIANFKEMESIARYEIDTEKDRRLNLSALKRTGYYKLKLRADDGKGLIVENDEFVYLTDDTPTKAVKDKITTIDKWLTAVKTTCEPGEKAEIWIAGREANTRVYYEIAHNDSVIETRWLTTSSTPVKLTVPVEEKHRGGFAIQTFMIQHNRLYSEITQITVPYTNKMLDVSLATFRDKLLPGENEQWTVTVADKKGGKAAAEIAATLYDASLDKLDMSAKHGWPDLATLYHKFSPAYYWSSLSMRNIARPNYSVKLKMGTWRIAPATADINWDEASYRNVLFANSGSGRGMLLRRAASNGRTMGTIAYANDNRDFFVGGTGEQTSRSLEEVAVVAFGKQKSEVDVIAETMQIEEDGVFRASGVDLTQIETRTNFSETAFFYPALRTNAEGEALIEFTIPEALTCWKLLSFAHTADFKTGTYTNELITQKQVAVSANPPRFFRESDEIEFTAKVNNLTAADLKGQALLRLYDALTMQPVDSIIVGEEGSKDGSGSADGSGITPFSVKAGESVGLRWTLRIPVGLQAVSYKLTAQAGEHSDGEEKIVPVLSNSMLVTETMPFSIRAGKEKTFRFDKLVKNKSATLRHHRLTLEYTSAPAWYAVQALPYIMEYPYECAEQTFSRFYANTLATTIVNSTPRIKQVFELWKSLDDGKALLSKLEKNEELKQVMLEETPWVVEAKNETERKQRLGLLFDLNRMSNELSRARNKLKNMQNSDGGFPWFEGSPSSRYITQHILAGMAHLRKIEASGMNGAKDTKSASGAKGDNGANGDNDTKSTNVTKGAKSDNGANDEIANIGEKAFVYIDIENYKDYDRLIREKSDLDRQNISAIHLHYLYACSFSGRKPDDSRHLAAFNYYLQQAGLHWNNFPLYNKAIAALALHRYGETATAKSIIRSLKEAALRSDELGMYWKDNVAGYFWHQAPIETQALLIEAFNEIGNDVEAVEEMKIWLLRHKQTNDWRTTKATSEAIYALLMTGGNLLDESQLLEVSFSGRPLAEVVVEPVEPEAGTGYVKTAWQGTAVTPALGLLTVRNPNTRGVAWGGLYWQYFEELDKITASEKSSALSIS